MVRNRASVLLRVVALFCLVATTAPAEENLGWHFVTAEQGGTLFYGIPQSGHAPLSFSCAEGDRELAFVFAFEPINAVDGVEVVVLLEANDISIPIPTIGTRLEMDDLFVLEGRTSPDARLLDLFGPGDVLSVFVEDGAEEYPLAGAREAAAALLESCGVPATKAALSGVEACAISAWSTDPDPKGLNVRAAPNGSAKIVGTLPAPRDIAGDRFATEVSVTGSKGGWLRISEAHVIDYVGDGPTEIVFEGEGWVSGRHLGLALNQSDLYGGPSAASARVATLVGEDPDGLAYGPDSFRVDRIHACRGDWVEVEGAIAIDGNPAGPRLRGWTRGTCSNQVTTCP